MHVLLTKSDIPTWCDVGGKVSVIKCSGVRV